MLTHYGEQLMNLLCFEKYLFNISTYKPVEVLKVGGVAWNLLQFVTYTRLIYFWFSLFRLRILSSILLSTSLWLLNYIGVELTDIFRLSVILYFRCWMYRELENFRSHSQWKKRIFKKNKGKIKTEIFIFCMNVFI